MKDNGLDTATRQQVAEFLPAALQKVADSYHAFMSQDLAGADTKEFTAHHTACKTAIAHIQLLLKLAQWADVRVDTAGLPDMTQDIDESKDEYSDFLNQEKT